MQPHRRLKQFRQADYKLLETYVDRYEGLIILPYVATEASNLLGFADLNATDNLRRQLRLIFEQNVEIHTACITACSHRHYVRLGLTDAAILTVLDENTRLLTTDFDLYQQASRAGHQVDNFNHLRSASDLF